MDGFLRYEFRGLIYGGAYFRNFTVIWSLNPPSSKRSSINFLLTSLMNYPEKGYEDC